jgi:hypothetical protein
MRSVQCCVASSFFATHNPHVMLRKAREEQPRRAAAQRKPRSFAMFDTFVSRARAGIAKRKRYNQLVSEINGLTERDLADMRASRSEMLYQVRRQIYG